MYVLVCRLWTVAVNSIESNQLAIKEMVVVVFAGMLLANAFVNNATILLIVNRNIVIPLDSSFHDSYTPLRKPED